MEKLCQYDGEDYGLETRVVRLHNVYGPLGAFEGGWEKAPAAIRRKIALADSGGVIDVWGDGKQTRSFMYVDGCVEGLHRLMCSDCPIPVNLDTAEMATVDELVKVVAQVAGKAVRIRHDRSMPLEANGGNSDSALFRPVLNWEPQVSLPEGLARTYAWIASHLAHRRATNDCPALACASARGRERHAIMAAA